jgi:hypothetical protein
MGMYGGPGKPDHPRRVASLKRQRTAREQNLVYAKGLADEVEAKLSRTVLAQDIRRSLPVGARIADPQVKRDLESTLALARLVGEPRYGRERLQGGDLVGPRGILPHSAAGKGHRFMTIPDEFLDMPPTLLGVGERISPAGPPAVSQLDRVSASGRGRRRRPGGAGVSMATTGQAQSPTVLGAF